MTAVTKRVMLFRVYLCLNNCFNVLCIKRVKQSSAFRAGMLCVGSLFDLSSLKQTLLHCHVTLFEVA